MIVGLIDSGFGLLPTAARLRKLRPELDLLLLMDPDNAPWGPKRESWVSERVVSTARSAVAAGAEVIVLPCNTASVTALHHVRAVLGDAVPVVGTVPAIKPAAAVSSNIAIWATAATTASAYQARLIAEFAQGRSVTGVACHGLAESIDRGDNVGIAASIRAAADATPPGVDAVVLGCTHYPLVIDRIRDALPPGIALFDSADAVARQTLKRVDELGSGNGRSGIRGSGQVDVRLSGRVDVLPAGAAIYDAGQVLAANPQHR